MIGIFTLRKSYILSSLLVPLLAGTIAWSWYVDKSLKPLSKYVGLSSVFEVQRGEETADVLQLRAGHPVTWSQSNLNRRRYAQNDDTLYVAPEDERTDYSQPPMANWYSGVLNTGKRRYGHPALNGVLPEPWLPLKKGQTLTNNDRNGNHRPPKDSGDQAVVLTLRKRYSRGGRRRSQDSRRDVGNSSSTGGVRLEVPDGDPTVISNPWEDTRPRARRSYDQAPASHRLSYDHASGVIMLPDDGDWLEVEEEDDDSDEQNFGTANGLEVESILNDDSVVNPPSSPNRPSRYGTYFHHPERSAARRRQSIPGAFPPS